MHTYVQCITNSKTADCCRISISAIKKQQKKNTIPVQYLAVDTFEIKEFNLVSSFYSLNIYVAIKTDA